MTQATDSVWVLYVFNAGDGLSCTTRPHLLQVFLFDNIITLICLTNEHKQRCILRSDIVAIVKQEFPNKTIQTIDADERRITRTAGVTSKYWYYSSFIWIQSAIVYHRKDGYHFSPVNITQWDESWLVFFTLCSNTKIKSAAHQICARWPFKETRKIRTVLRNVGWFSSLTRLNPANQLKPILYLITLSLSSILLFIHQQMKWLMSRKSTIQIMIKMIMMDLKLWATKKSHPQWRSLIACCKHFYAF